MKLAKHFLPAAGVFTVLQLAIMQAYAAPLNLSNLPLFLTSASKANVLMMYGNSNSMDTDPTGKAVGSASPLSKSEIARKAVSSVVANYSGLINMGLMAYQQNDATSGAIFDSQYDVSFEEADYKPNSVGPRNSKEKRFRVPNPLHPELWMYYNINLPFYDSAQSTPRFCKSDTACTSPANDFKGIAPACTKQEDPDTGPFDDYQCYADKTGLNNKDGWSKPNTRKSNFHPTDSDLGQGITDFGKILTYYYVAPAWVDNTAPGKGYLHVPVRDLDATQAAAINKKLAVSQFKVNAKTDPEMPLQNSGLSPLEGTVSTANLYFRGALTDKDQGGSQPKPPESCAKNFLVTLTDGLPSVTPAGVKSANVAANLEGLVREVTALKESTSKTETYVVGFALPYGVDIKQLDTIAAAGGSKTAYNANDTATLNAAFASIFSDIISKTSAASSVALSSRNVVTDAHVYQARFSSADWSGQLLNFTLDKGVLAAKPVWDAGQELGKKAPGDRVIITYKPSLNKAPRGIAFRWPVNPASPGAGELDTVHTNALSLNGAGTADAALGAARLAYLRGETSNEGEAGLKFRKRPNTKLGDIVNSSPVYVGAPSANIATASYRDFKKSYQSRTSMVYVGANDGMLHGFDAATGEEKLAYVPSSMYANLGKLSDPRYIHRYFVDGLVYANDVELSKKGWRTVLASGMGLGARGIFALDVTNPSAFTEAKAAEVAAFEFTEANDPDVGYVTGSVNIVKLADGHYGAVFGNGYNNSGSGKAALFIVDIETGALIRKLDTPDGDTTTPNAMATPLLIDSDNDGAVDIAYAGDLRGNMWKFDLSGNTSAKWNVAYKLFKAPQPITAAPDAGEYPTDEGGFMVYFGTGKYLEQTDVVSKPGNAVYGIWDKPLTDAVKATFKDLLNPVVTSAKLTAQTYATLTGTSYRTVTNNAPDYKKGSLGWMTEFADKGERLVSEPVLRDGRLIFNTIIPSDALCTPGGTSWVNQVEWMSGGQVAISQFDTNGDGKFNKSDTNVSGYRIDSIISGPAIQDTLERNKALDPEYEGARETTMANGSDGEVKQPPGRGDPKHTRRLSWRQVK